MKALRRSLVCLGVGVAAATAAWLIHKAGWLDRPELVTWDVRERWLGAAAPSDVPIKLILIDQSSLDWAREQAGSPWPWPREFYTKIIDFCKAGNAKAIAFDLFFSEPSMFGQDDDNRFAEALKSTRATVLAVPPGPHLSQPAGWPEGIPPSPFQITGLEQWIRSHPQADLSLNSAVMSLPEISENASLLGHVRADQDADSIIRRLAPIVTFDGQVLPALSLAAFEVSQVSDRARIPEFQVTENSLVFDGHAIPLDHEGLAVLRYRKPTLRGDQRRMYEAFSAAGIINSQLAIEERKTPQVSPEVFKDCYVFIGTSAAGTYDLKPTPVNKAGPGVEVQAAFLDNLLYNGFIHSSNPAWTILFTLILSIIAVFATRESRNSFHVVSAFVLMLPAPWLTGFVAYTSGWQWPIVLPEVGVCLALVGGLTINYATEGRQRRFIKHSFQHYLSGHVIEQLLQDPSRLRLGGERRELSVFFSDLAGFSSIAEKLDPEVLAEVLNDYLTVMTDIILEEEGTLDKYIGDAIVAFWNAPLDQPDHRLRAMRAASRCQQAMEVHRVEYLRRLGADLRMRIGVNTGVATVGNFGSHARFDYTMIGHTVNLASRLEGANKVFGTSTLIAYETWRQLDNSISGREIARLQVVGIREPVCVYQFLPDGATISRQSLDAFQTALKMCQSGNAESALPIFEQLSDDPIAQRYCEKLRSMSPGVRCEWNGVWNLTEK